MLAEAYRTVVRRIYSRAMPALARKSVRRTLVALLLVGPLAAGQTPAPAAGRPTLDTERGVISLEMLVDDAKGQAITNLKLDEVVVEQDGVRQSVSSFELLPETRRYELRYAPHSGQPGPLLIRVLRGGSRVRGPDGPSVKPRWIPPPPAFELPLRAALAAPLAPNEFGYELAVLRFEARAGTLHHSFVVEIPLREVIVARMEARLAFLLRVLTSAGRVVHSTSLEQPVALDQAGEAARSVKRFIWIDHAHLPAGSYVVEVAVEDQNGAHRSVRRSPFTVAPWSPGLRMSSPAFLLGREGLMHAAQADDPFRLEDSALVPVLRPTWTVGTEVPLSLLAYVYPDPDSQEPVNATLAVERDGTTRGTGAVPLPAADSDGRIRFLGGLRLRRLEPGSYDVRFVVRQGAATVEERAVVLVAAPMRFESKP